VSSRLQVSLCELYHLDPYLSLCAIGIINKRFLELIILQKGKLRPREVGPWPKSHRKPMAKPD
jgi:hypothetical protein